jgi:hypothetical protein
VSWPSLDALFIASDLSLVLALPAYTISWNTHMSLSLSVYGFGLFYTRLLDPILLKNELLFDLDLNLS